MLEKIINVYVRFESFLAVLLLMFLYLVVGLIYDTMPPGENSYYVGIFPLAYHAPESMGGFWWLVYSFVGTLIMIGLRLLAAIIVSLVAGVIIVPIFNWVLHLIIPEGRPAQYSSSADDRQVRIKNGPVYASTALPSGRGPGVVMEEKTVSVN